VDTASTCDDARATTGVSMLKTMWTDLVGVGFCRVKRFFETDDGRDRALEHSADRPGVSSGPSVHTSASPQRAAPERPAGASVEEVSASARIAVYDDLRSAPRVEEVRADSAAAFIETLATRTYEVARSQGGAVPYTVIREVVENLIHARFRETVVSVLEEGSTIRFSDRGPGIEDKERTFSPGFSTATAEMKRVIRGVGSGLPIVKEYLTSSGGYVAVEDNLGSGTVVTIRLEPPEDDRRDPQPRSTGQPISPGELSTRHKKVLSLAMELGSVGPSAVSRELGVALSTAYRDLAFLEERGLVTSDTAGKRSLSESGVTLLDSLFAS
jgi:hypothetical protein